MPVQPLASVTFTVIGNEPVCVGVPLNTPAEDRVNPVGSAPEFNVNPILPKAPLCVKFSLKAAPAVPVPVPGLLTVIV